MIVYSNGCSFGLPTGPRKISYSYEISKKIGANYINQHRAGSCNRRIIRKSLRDLISLKQQYDDILVLIGLSFFFRTELWQPNKPAIDNDGNFHPVSIEKAHVIKTKSSYSGDIDDAYQNTNIDVRDWYKQWLIWENKEAIITETLADIIMFSSFCATNKIRYLIWNNSDVWPDLPAVNREDIFLKNFNEYAMTSLNMIDPWKFGFLPWALAQGLEPIDRELYGDYGHPGEEAHIKLSEFLMDHINTRNII